MHAGSDRWRMRLHTLQQNMNNRLFSILVFVLLGCCAASAQTPQFVPFSAAEPVLNTYLSSLPAELKPSGKLTAAAWDNWIRTQDKDIRARIEEGEENTLTNLLRLGVTYTKEPRISYEYLAEYGHSSFVDGVADKRANDLIKALSAPHPSEGMQEMKALLEKKGYSLKSPEDQKKVKAYLLANLARLRDDVARDAQTAKTNKYQAFKDRGISTDSNLYPDYTIRASPAAHDGPGFAEAGQRASHRDRGTRSGLREQEIRLGLLPTTDDSALCRDRHAGASGTRRSGQD